MRVETSSRLDAVLRAGRSNLVVTGDLFGSRKGAVEVATDETMNKTALDRARASNALASALQQEDLLGSPRNVAKIAPSEKHPSAAVVEDLIDKYRLAAATRRSSLEEARKIAEDCAKVRAEAVTNYRDAQEKAADDAINSLQTTLAEKEAEIDRMQNASAATVRELEALTDQDGTSSARVEKLEKALAETTNEKDAIARELEFTQASRTDERAKAEELATTQLQEKEAEASAKLLEAQTEATKAAAVAAKDLETCLEEKETLLLASKNERADMTKLNKEKQEQEEKFKKAATEACEALREYTQWSSA